MQTLASGVGPGRERVFFTFKVGRNDRDLSQKGELVEDAQGDSKTTQHRKGDRAGQERLFETTDLCRPNRILGARSRDDPDRVSQTTYDCQDGVGL